MTGFTVFAISIGLSAATWFGRKTKLKRITIPASAAFIYYLLITALFGL